MPDTEGMSEEIQYFLNSDWCMPDGVTLPKFEYTPLHPDNDEARFLVLQPAATADDHVRCTVETYPLENLPPFVAIKNARGYRMLTEMIEVGEKIHFTTVALERFLRFLRTQIEQPTRIWARSECIVNSDPQERAKYWKREFSDDMYARATEVYDMHEINSRRIEDGELKRVADWRYIESTKEWTGSLDHITLPKMFPIRLGAHCNNEAPKSSYEYMPLDMVSNEIRFMCIMPSEDINAPIIIHAAHCPIKCEVTVIALSCKSVPDHQGLPTVTKQASHYRSMGNRLVRSGNNYKRPKEINSQNPCKGDPGH